MTSSSKPLSSSSFLLEIESRSLLSVVHGLSELAVKKGSIRQVRPNERVALEGDEIADCIIPINEPLSLLQRGEDGKEAFVGFLQKGRSLALAQLLEGGRYRYSAVATVATAVLFVPKKDFVDLLDAQPLVRHYLRSMSQSPALRKFKDALSGQDATLEEIIEVFSHVETRTKKLAEGERYRSETPELVFLEAGTLLVSPHPQSDHAAATLEAGTFFGGEGLVPPHRLTYDAQAQTDMTYRVAPLPALQPLLGRLGLVDFLFTEPCIGQRVERDDATRIMKPLPAALDGAEPLSADEAVGRAIPVLPPEKTVLAHSDEESFAASVTNGARLCGVDINATTLATELSADSRISPLKIAEVLESSGLHVTAFRCAAGDLSRQPFPSLLVLGKRLCVLVKVEGSHGFLLDPATGLVRLPLSALARQWDGALLGLERNESSAGESEQTDHPRRTLNGLIGALLREYRPSLVNALLLSLGLFGLGLLGPLFSQEILDEALSLRDVTTLTTCIVGLVLVTVFSIVAAVARTLVLAEFAVRFDKKLSSFFYRHAVSLPSSFFSGKRAGKMLARLMEIWVVRDFLTSSSVQSVTDGFSLLVFGAVLFAYSSQVALVPVAGLGVMVGIQLLYRRRLARNHATAFEAQQTSTSLLTEEVNAMMTIKATGAEKVARDRWEDAYLTRARAQRTAAMDGTTAQGLAGFVARVMTLAGLWSAASLALKGELSPGQVLAISMYLDQVTSPIANLSNVLSQWERIKVALAKLNDIFSSEPEQRSDAAHVTYSLPLRGKIRFENVSFRYSDDAPWVLKNVSFTIYPRQVVALVGRSGCGKTTLAGLISGVLKPTSGRIFFDEFDSSFLSLHSLRRQLGFIVQQRDLFRGTLLDNIAYADDAPTQERAERAAELANATEFISRAPNGLGYYLGEGGMGLSGGQMQRLTIARTVYRDPKILIMDEATSALDLESERQVVENLREILQGKTTIVIAHRLSTIRNADTILVMKDGELVEEGPHARLIAGDGHYAELFGRQALAVA